MRNNPWDKFKKDTTEVIWGRNCPIHDHTSHWHEPMDKDLLLDSDWEYAFTCSKCGCHAHQTVFDPGHFFDNRTICLSCGIANKIKKEEK